MVCRRPNRLQKRILLLGLAALLAAVGGTARGSCGDEFARLQGVVSYSRSQLLEALRREITDAKVSSVTLVESGRHTVLKIGYVQNDDRELMKLISLGVRNDAFGEFQIGDIVGPKAVNWMSRLMEMTPKKSPMKFTGKFSPRELIEAQIEEAELGVVNRVTTSGAPDPLYWGAREIKDFQTSFDKLKVREACHRIYGTIELSQCGPLSFTIIPGTSEYHFEKP